MLNEIQTISIVAASLFFLLLAVFFALFISFYKRKRIQNIREQQNIRLQFQQQLLQSKIEIQEQAFSNISRELHDNLGQQLSLAKLNLSTLKEITNAIDQEKIDSTRELIADSIYQIRSISKTLLGEKVSSMGIGEAIKNEAERINKLGTCKVSCHITSQTLSLDLQKEIILFRMVQEALNNALKHANAQNIDISLHYNDPELQVLIVDNGKGFNLVSEKMNGIGLMNLENRADTIGATLNIISAPDKGTQIEIIVNNQ